MENHLSGEKSSVYYFIYVCVVCVVGNLFLRSSSLKFYCALIATLVSDFELFFPFTQGSWPV